MTEAEEILQEAGSQGKLQKETTFL